MRIVVTGASGFVGSALLERLRRDRDVQPVAATRAQSVALPGGVSSVVAGDVNSDRWSEALSGTDVVVHAAARAHILNESTTDPLAEFRRVNTIGTENVARAAVRAGVRRFVFVSSIKVNGERTAPGRPFLADDAPAPRDAYGVSKREAEQKLSQIGRDAGMEVVIIRPVLVYGPGVKANFLSMMQVIRRGLPLPLGAVHNLRSVVSLVNLVDLIALSARHRAAANEIFLVSDGDDVSTPTLLRRTAAAMRMSVVLLPVPPTLLRAAGRLTGRGAAVERLCDSLQVDLTKTQKMLGWKPPQDMTTALKETAEHFLARSSET